jgi:glucose-6-phosphate isomerase
MGDITRTDEWGALRAHQAELAGTTLRELFAADPSRGTVMCAQGGELYLDYSKHLVTAETIQLLTALAERADLAARIDSMFSGELVNASEQRPALHTALRLPPGSQLVVQGVDVAAEVHAVQQRMVDFATRIRTGTIHGSTGKPIRTVVNIGIGGSHLGPQMAYEALPDYHQPGIACRFVSNGDPTDVADVLVDLDPAGTLFVVSSKTFTTAETTGNARVARRWLSDQLGGTAVGSHFVAVSANVDRAVEFGIDPERTFPMWDWVGGRYSFDSAIGLPVMIAVGPDHFRDLLAGMHTIDQHFRTAPWHANLPVLQGLLGVWYRNFLGADSHVVLPYSKRLHRFPAYLQQLTMESTGKSVQLDGAPVTTATGEIYWGEPGTNGQHAFYQLLHQGTVLVPADFIGFAEPPSPRYTEGYDAYFANLLAQSAALAFGRTAEEVAAEGADPAVAPHKVMPGDRPSSTVLAPRLTPSVLGQLTALYEHTVYVKGVIWGINCFDQWGVELGKVLAEQIAPMLSGDEAEPSGLDSSTTALIGRYHGLRADAPPERGDFPSKGGGDARAATVPARS